MLVIFISYPFFNIIISILYFFFFNDTATTEIYTLSLHDALPILHYNRTGGRERPPGCRGARATGAGAGARDRKSTRLNSSHLVISYAVFCLKKKKKIPICSYVSYSTCSSTTT